MKSQLSRSDMTRFAIVLESVLSVAIVAVSISILYLAYSLVPPASVAAPTAISAAAVAETHVGPVGGRTQLFTIDAIMVGGNEVAHPIKGRRASFAISKASDIVFSGWALDSRVRKPASRVIAVVGKDVTVGPIAVARPDVVSAFQLSPGSVDSGFNLSVPTADLEPGMHSVHFLVVGADGISVLDTNTSIDFTN